MNVQPTLHRFTKSIRRYRKSKEFGTTFAFRQSSLLSCVDERRTLLMREMSVSASIRFGIFLSINVVLFSNPVRTARSVYRTGTEGRRRTLLDPIKMQYIPNRNLIIPINPIRRRLIPSNRTSRSERRTRRSRRNCGTGESRRRVISLLSRIRGGRDWGGRREESGRVNLG